MARIKLLDEQLANQIAAGEVVERPSSVVKELVENAIDAGSTTIDITIEEGGLTLIRVVDNGDGIDEEDMLTAFERHATSKIASSSDLFRIASLGFRGEALPSIAAVAKVECISSINQTGLAQRVVIEGGKLVVNEPGNAPKGTTIIVRDLFFNTPARLKYMKTVQTELGHISDYINRIALAHPGIAITLKHNGNVLLRTLGSGDRLQVIAAIYGTSTAKMMLPIDSSDPDYEIIGYISKPELTRANRNGITIIVNGRYIKSIACNNALLEGYHTMLPINRFPLAVVEIQMHPALLDVNVHPSKLEVRFSKEQELKALIQAAVREKLGNIRYTPGLDSIKKRERSGPELVQGSISFHVADEGTTYSSSASGTGSSTGISGMGKGGAGAGNSSSFPFSAGNSRAFSSAATPAQQATFGNTGTGSRQPASAAHNEKAQESIPKDAAERLYGKPSTVLDQAEVNKAGSNQSDWQAQATAADTANENCLTSLTNGRGADGDTSSSSSTSAATSEAATSIAGIIAASASSEASVASSSTASSEASAADQGAAYAAHENQAGAGRNFPELHWIGQHHGTYIIAQADDGLYLIDQHAAHERINYEYYLVKFGQPQAASQQLLVPLTMELTPGDAASLKDLLPYLEQAGVFMEPFGQQTYLVRAYPEWLPKGQEAEIVDDMVQYVLEQRKRIDLMKFREEAAIMCSCKASIKANDRMTREEGEGLLKRLAACVQPYTCPHGRPIIVHLSTYQLEKMFKRVMS